MSKIEKRFAIIREDLHQVASQIAARYVEYGAQVSEASPKEDPYHWSRGFNVQFVAGDEPIYIDVLLTDSFASEGEEADVKGDLEIAIETDHNDKRKTFMPGAVAGGHYVPYDNDAGFDQQLNVLRSYVPEALALIDEYVEGFKTREYRP